MGISLFLTKIYADLCKRDSSIEEKGEVLKPPKSGNDRLQI